MKFIGEQFLLAVDQNHIAEQFCLPQLAEIHQGIGINNSRIALLDADVAHCNHPHPVFDGGRIAIHKYAVLMELDFAHEFLKDLAALLNEGPLAGKIYVHRLIALFLLCEEHGRHHKAENEDDEITVHCMLSGLVVNILDS